MLTLDYELFFGKNSGSLNSCILNPTNKIIEILDKHDIKASFFVDAGYIERLEQEQKKFPTLEKEYHQLCQQISTLYKSGHDVQLHIHPHWKDSFYTDSGWKMDVSRYRLHDFSKEDAAAIISDFKNVLENIIEDKVFTYRAGGWCIQPFSYIAEALYSQGVFVDSTVFRNGIYHSDTHAFDFTSAENKTSWQFNENPSHEEIGGKFYEFPISSIKVSPLFFWRLAGAKKFGGEKHFPLGDGGAVKSSSKDLFKMLSQYSTTVVSMDGYKSSLMEKALQHYQRHYSRDDYFVMIGHPKAATPYSLGKLEEFLENHSAENDFTTYRQEMKNGNIGFHNE